MALITQQSLDFPEVNVSIGAGFEPDAIKGQGWHISIYDDETEQELYAYLPRGFAKEVIATLQRYLERTE